MSSWSSNVCRGVALSATLRVLQPTVLGPSRCVYVVLERAVEASSVLSTCRAIGDAANLAADRIRSSTMSSWSSSVLSRCRACCRHVALSAMQRILLLTVLGPSCVLQGHSAYCGVFSPAASGSYTRGGRHDFSWNVIQAAVSQEVPRMRAWDPQSAGNRPAGPDRGERSG